jgi:molybdopterin-guanine dinucleotide biosynthesis protein A
MSITGIVLAGGLGQRMGGVDKGLVNFLGKPLVAHVVDRLNPQVEEILINANRELDRYNALGYEVLQDEIANFAGPLAGFSQGLQHARHEYLLTVPCDSPLLPLDLAQRLLNGMLESRVDIAVASSNGNAHPVFCLCKKSVLPSLTDYLANGNRKVSAWQKSLPYIEVDFSDCADAFVNINTLEDLAALELKSGHA